MQILLTKESEGHILDALEKASDYERAVERLDDKGKAAKATAVFFTAAMRDVRL
jgi:hypothetical protein